MISQTGAGPNAIRFKPAHPDNATAPVVSIPTETRQDESGYVCWTINTEHGPVEVTAKTWEFLCAGSAECLIAASLVDASWLPGIQGNNVSSQTIAFTPEGPMLVIGNRATRKLNYPLAVVSKLSSKRFSLRIAMTKHEREAIGLIADANRRPADTSVKSGDEQRSIESVFREHFDGPHGESCYASYVQESINGALDSVKRYALSREYKVALSDECQARILAAINEVRQALLPLHVIRTSRAYERVGNITYLTGRGATPPGMGNAR